MDNTLLSYGLFKGFHRVKAFTTLKQTLPEKTNPRFTGNPVTEVIENRQKLAQVLDIDAGQMVFPRQTHTRSVACLADMPAGELMETDALVTNQPGICLCVQTADCVPVLLFDPVKNAAGAVHAGWRGTVGRIAGEAIAALKECYSSDPANLHAVIGPSIGPDRYEVGDEVAEEVIHHVPNPWSCLKKYPSGKYHLNLWEANRQILLQYGVAYENIEIAGYCTHAGEEHFFSARREGIETGRLVSGIMLLPE